MHKISFDACSIDLMLLCWFSLPLAWLPCLIWPSSLYSHIASCSLNLRATQISVVFCLVGWWFPMCLLNVLYHCCGTTDSSWSNCLKLKRRLFWWKAEGAVGGRGGIQLCGQSVEMLDSTALRAATRSASKWRDSAGKIGVWHHAPKRRPVKKLDWELRLSTVLVHQLDIWGRCQEVNVMEMPHWSRVTGGNSTTFLVVK